MSYLQQLVSGKRLITAMELTEPSPSCIVCGTAQLQLTINTAKTPLQDFVDKVNVILTRSGLGAVLHLLKLKWTYLHLAKVVFPEFFRSQTDSNEAVLALECKHALSRY